MATTGSGIPGVVAGNPLTSPTCKKQSNDIFHLSPFAQLHESTISPIYTHRQLRSSAINSLQHCDNSSSEGDHPGIFEFRGMDDVSKTPNCQVQLDDPFPNIVPILSSAAEAYLLLEAARAERQVWLT
ncbi:hypothetical protein PISMIDRAFT_25653 [Pisolithus microcarpus 441]|uniref:Uncharacterized protein n=1 Tax=Pisolithus microcarpus 441 TaxID=765257 RepID=A0A0C9YQ18_9AGAM|nr:hypothetical protein PISMIDRAFT_25653 [Pisolithus microcarpus 441]